MNKYMIINNINIGTGIAYIKLSAYLQNRSPLAQPPTLGIFLPFIMITQYGY
jgi:hypothetical protein